jgi:hypothetical protein
MISRHDSLRPVLIGLFALALVPVFGQDAPPPPAERHHMPAPKNLKLLTPDQLMPAMMAFKSALGVECTFCHVQGDFASDDNHHKEIARHMISMAKDINAKFPDGQTHVTCYTCHRGATEPATTAPAP